MVEIKVNNDGQVNIVISGTTMDVMAECGCAIENMIAELTDTTKFTREKLKDVLNFNQIFKKIDGNEPAIYVDRGQSLEILNVLQTGVKFLGNELQDYKHSVDNECM